MELSQEKRIIVVVSAAHFLTHMFVLIFPAVVLPYARELGVPPAEVFSLGFYMYFFYGAMAIPAGFFADRWSRVGILKICVAGMAGASLLAAFSHSQAGFAIALALIGVFCGFYHPAGMGIIAHHIPKQGSAHGINGIFGNLGIAAAPLFSGAVILLFGWRWVFLLTAVLGAIGLLLLVALPIDEKRGVASSTQKPAGQDDGRNIRYFLILCGAMTMAGLVYRANMTALPAMMELNATDLIAAVGSFTTRLQTADAQSGVSALIVSTLFLFSMAAQYIGGKVADRADLRWAYLAFQASAVPFALGMAHFANLPLYFSAAGLVFFTLGMQPIENSLVSKFLPAKWLSTGYGIKFTLVFGIGSLAIHQVAYVDARWGLAHIYSFLTVEAMMTASFALALIVASRALPRVSNH